MAGVKTRRVHRAKAARAEYAMHQTNCSFCKFLNIYSVRASLLYKVVVSVDAYRQCHKCDKFCETAVNISKLDNVARRSVCIRRFQGDRRYAEMLTVRSTCTPVT